MESFHEYIRAIEKELIAGNATEHTHRPALKTLLESLGHDVTATNEPRRIDCGAPDFVLTRGATTVGYVEAKDVGKSLDEAERTEQMERYRESLSNLVLTDYLEFRWYTDGELRNSARLGRPAPDGRIRRDREGTDAVSALLADFFSHTSEPASSPRELALRMARLAHLIRDLIIAAFDREPETGSLHSQFLAFRDNLIPDLTAGQFADMYSQTIAYGLFAARCAHEGPTGFTRQNAAYLLPKTNPFLRRMFGHIAGPELDDRIAWLVEDLTQLLARADIASILQDFGRRTAREDPVVHFYETFLAAYDPRVRERRGIYYTPEPVVSFIVHSIDCILKTRFSRPQGLADPAVLIFDPAVGTATFLYSVIREVHEALVGQGQRGLWNDYVATRLLNRLFGFELLMAPYAVAHLKLGVQLKDLGYDFRSDERLGVYLTNTLEEAVKRAETLFDNWIKDEANAAAEIKKDRPIMVVLGNPPYSGLSANASVREVFDPKTNRVKRELTWIGSLIEDYKRVDGKALGEKNPKWLHDDYVKFIRFGQWRIDRTGDGVLAFITNHSYLDNPTFRGMRWSLMNTFTDIYILDLHGNVKKREKAPDGGKDENVFDIQQGVAIGIFVKEKGKKGPAQVHHAELWGLRGEWPDSQEGTKYHALSSSDVTLVDWAELQPRSPSYFFVPTDVGLLDEYERGWKVTDIFPVNSVGIVTARDELAIHWTADEIWDTVRDFSSLPEEEARQKYHLGNDAQDWKVALAQRDVRDSGLRRDLVVPVLYRPFDVRYTYYTGQSRGLICRPRADVMRHMLAGENLGLIVTRQTTDPFAVLATRAIAGHKSVATYHITSLFPLHLHPVEGQLQLDGGGRRPNLNLAFVADLCGRLGVSFPAWVGWKGQAGEKGQARVPDPSVEQSPSTAPETQEQMVEQPPPAVQSEGQMRAPVAPVEPPPAVQDEGQVRAPVPPQGEQTAGRVAGVGSELTVTRRHLPHWQLGGSTYFVTFRTREGIELSPEERGVVIESCLHGHPDTWQLHAVIVMPDHVHIMLMPAETRPGEWVSLSQIMQGIKGATAHRINGLRGRKGAVWQDESYDRIIRDEAEFEEKWKYICDNAARASLGEDGLAYPYFWWEGKEEREITPEDIFNYAYAVFHCPTYRERYADYLKTDFPRLPLTSDFGLFRALAEKGAELVALHLLESPVLEKSVTRFDVPGSNFVEGVRYDEAHGRVYINKEQYFEGIEPVVWEFQVGGYQVCQKWLKDRKGRNLAWDDAIHYEKIVVALRETIRIIGEIDALIPGWPLS